ncbi:MAG: LysR substrate-binding domain-containing protein [Anaerolineae bacterium]
MIECQTLQVFVEAAIAQNFTVASRRLHLSQPAVSLQIRNLEKHLGVALFKRSGRRVTLSEAGELLLPQAQDILRRLKQVEESMWALHGVVIGNLTIACSTTAGKYVLPRLVAGFRQLYPEVRVTVNVMSRRAATEWLLTSRADISVVSTRLQQCELDFQPFLQDHVVLIVPAGHPWSDGRAVRAEELCETPFIQRESAAGSYQVVAEALTARGLDIANLQSVLTLANAEAIEMSVEAGIGAAFVSRLAAERGLELGRVCEVPVQDMTLTRTIYMVRHQRRPATPAQGAFWDFALNPASQPIRRLPAGSALSGDSETG